MDELENRDGLDIEQEAPQEAQEAPVTAETGRGEETDTQEPEAARSPQRARKTAARKNRQPNSPQRRLKVIQGPSWAVDARDWAPAW